MRNMCAKGVGRPDPRTRPQLEKVAEFFRIPINAFWEPGLLIWIWAGRSYPEGREHFVSDFHLDQVLKENPKLYREWLNQMEYREDLEDLQRDRREKLVPPLPNPDRPAPADSIRVTNSRG